MIPAIEALRRLRDGNRRFASDMPIPEMRWSLPRRAELAQQQRPFATILGCSDSRVPVEIVFDQGPGDLFVVRVAGNIVAPSQIASIEFAAARLETRLVVVLGHSRCGAVLAALEEVQQAAANPSGHLGSIVERIRPAVEPLVQSEVAGDPDALVRHAVRANVAASVQQLRDRSEILQQLIRDAGLRVVGAEYSLETGVVEFLEGVSA